MAISRTLSSSASVLDGQVVSVISDDEINSWTNDDESVTSLYVNVSETSPLDEDYITNDGAVSDDKIRFKLATASDPNVSNGYVIWYRVNRTTTRHLGLVVRLVQGASTKIAAWSHSTLPSEVETFSHTLTPEQADLITDHSDLYLEFISKPTFYTWTDLGQDTVIAATVSVNSQVIRATTFWNGVIWLGHGDTNATTRPLRPRYYDPSDSTFKTLTGFSSGLLSDGLWYHFIADNRLWIPFNDPAGTTQDVLVVSFPFSGSVIDTSPPDVTHLWHMAEHGGALYLAGAGSGATHEAAIWRSTDLGASWTKVYQPNITNGDWFCWLASYNGFLWTTPIDAQGGGFQTLGVNSLKSSDGTTWTDAGFQITPGGNDNPITSVEFAGSLFIKSAFAVPNENYGKLIKFDGTATGTNISSSVNNEVVMGFATTNDKLFVLTSANIYETSDGNEFVAVTGSPSLPGSIGTDGTTLYVGTRSSHLWKAESTL